MALGLALIANAGVLVDGAVAEAQQGRSVATGHPIVFDLPAQPLVSALERYSVASGWQVIYDAGLATGRRSASVKGDFTPPVALQMLLAGTGLIPQVMAADGVMLVPDPMSTSARQETPTNAGSPVGKWKYYGRVQAGLKRALCADARIRSGAYRIALGFWVGSSGTVTRTALLGSTGRADVDETFDRAVQRLTVGEPPPAGFDQPIVILVTPDLVRQCDAAEAGLQPVKAGQ